MLCGVSLSAMNSSKKISEGTGAAAAAKDSSPKKKMMQSMISYSPSKDRMRKINKDLDQLM